MKKLLSIILSITMLLTMSTAVFAEGIASSTPDSVLTFDELTKISTKDIKKISIVCSKNNRTEVAISSPLIISSIVNGVKDIQFVEDTKEGSAGGWLYFINFYMEDEAYIQYGARLHIDKIDYNAVDYNAAIEKMAYYHDLIKSIDSNEWAKDYILESMEIGFLDDNSVLKYKEPITREEFCELIYNYCYNVIKEVDTVTGENKFNDTTNSKIIRLNAMGIINGKSETEFAPDDLLTREEAAVILRRMVNKTIPVPVTEMYFNFDDEADISDWALDSIQVMCNMGVMNGVGDNKFAPQDTYTTEQAIATIVRVYAAQSANTGIIGGADTPTEIYIGEDVEVSDFYIEEAFKHAKKAGELAGTKEFISMYIPDDETKTSIENLSKTDFEKPAGMYYLSYNIDKVVEYYNKMIVEERYGEEIDIKKYIELNGFNLSVFASQINGRYGVTTLAATTVLKSREGYIMPEDFENDFGIYLQYEGDYSALVTFDKIGEGVIEARMQFVRNAKGNEQIGFMKEIYDAWGEESISIARIKS